MRKNDYKPQHDGGGGGGGGKIGGNTRFIPSSFRSFSSYLRIVSSGASTVASTVRSAASAVVDRDNDAVPDQVLWAGFDTLEPERNRSRRVLLLGFHLGFQVWDVEDSNNVRNVVSRHDGAVSFMQTLPEPTAAERARDGLADSRPLLAVCADSSGAGPAVRNARDQSDGFILPTVVWFYSLKSQSYVKELKFRSVVYSVRCSSRVVAVLQAAQVHCFDALTLQRDYTILTNPIETGFSGFRNIGLGPLALGPRWIAYSGSAVELPDERVSPQHLTGPAGRDSNGSVVAHYAKQSSKQLAVGIVTLGDMGYKTLSRYYSEQSGDPGRKDRGTANGHVPEAEDVGMVIVRDVISRSVVAQFKAHESPIASLCFDPSGTVLVTASVHGHNFNVFRVTPGPAASSSENGAPYVHLYRLQRGFTNAVIQDISFSVDSRWITISSSRGTSHLFAISPSGGPVNLPPTGESYVTTNTLGYRNNAAARKKPSVLGSPGLGPQTLRASGPPVTLSAVSRIRSGNSGWKNMVTAAAAASGRPSPHPGIIASAFHRCNGSGPGPGSGSGSEYHILVFSSSGCMIQYALRMSLGPDSGPNAGFDTWPGGDPRLAVEPVQKWNLGQRLNRREREENVDIYGENGHAVSRKVFPELTDESKGERVRGTVKVEKENGSLDERNHVYISEAELQMHRPRFPLWARTQIYFQSLTVDDIVTNGESNSKGEFEIEKIPSHTIEARSRDLVPVVDHLRGPDVQTTRVPALHSNGDEGVESPGSCEFRKLPYVITGHVNNDDGPKPRSRPETVNNRAGPASEVRSEVVNNNVDGRKAESQPEDGRDGFG